MSGRWLMAAVLGALVYLLMDGHPESWLSGLPWRPPSLILAVLGGIVVWVVWPKRSSLTSQSPRSNAKSGRTSTLLRTLAVAFVMLAVAKGVVGWQALPSGLPGWYFDNSRFQGDFERSTDYLGEPWTRRERELYFGGDEFPTYFLNDVQRFNFYGAEADKRRNQPFSVRWEGTLYAPADGTYQLWLTS